jgi:hypothetical protein
MEQVASRFGKSGNHCMGSKSWASKNPHWDSLGLGQYLRALIIHNSNLSKDWFLHSGFALPRHQLPNFYGLVTLSKLEFLDPTGWSSLSPETIATKVIKRYQKYVSSLDAPCMWLLNKAGVTARTAMWSCSKSQNFHLLHQDLYGYLARCVKNQSNKVR